MPMSGDSPTIDTPGPATMPRAVTVTPDPMQWQATLTLTATAVRQTVIDALRMAADPSLDDVVGGLVDAADLADMTTGEPRRYEAAERDLDNAWAAFVAAASPQPTVVRLTARAAVEVGYALITAAGIATGTTVPLPPPADLAIARAALTRAAAEDAERTGAA